jgi:hypothetical protein
LQPEQRNRGKTLIKGNVFQGTWAGAFVCGEETALLASIEGRVGEPMIRPPFPVEQGLWGRPTVINNVETWANVPHIIDQGAEWYAKLGVSHSTGTKIFSLVGKVKNSGLVEVSMGITLGGIIVDISGLAEIGDGVRVRDVVFSDKMKILADLEEVVAIAAAPKKEEISVEAPVAEEAAPEEIERGGKKEKEVPKEDKE